MPVVVALNENVTIGIMSILPEVEVAPVQRHQFAPAKPGAESREKERIVLGTVSPRCSEEDVRFFGGQR